jgi:hypothetical protein
MLPHRARPPRTNRVNLRLSDAELSRLKAEAAQRRVCHTTLARNYLRDGLGLSQLVSNAQIADGEPTAPAGDGSQVPRNA